MGDVIATYEIAARGDVARAAAVLAGEQSSGTFTAVARESDRIRRDHGAEVLSIEPLEPGPPALPGSVGTGPPARARVRVRFPLVNFGPSLPNLLTTVAGNLFELRDLAAVRLADLDLPAEFAARYPGPAFGVDGTRRLMGGPPDVMIGTIIKPSVGLTLDELRQVVRELGMAGIDFIKDDELIGDPPYAPLRERVPAVLDELKRVADATGKLPMYAFNITDDLDAMPRHHDLVLSAGGTCVMVVAPILGLAGVEYLRRRSALPIHGHRAGFGAVTRDPRLGLGFPAFQQAARLAGLDHLHTGGLNSKFYEDNDSVVRSVEAMRRPLFAAQAEPVPGAYAALPVLSSGQTPATAAPTYERLGGTDLLVLAGGGIHGHPGGVAEGVAAMRQAWEAAAAGVPVAEYAAARPALARALEAFGR